LTEPGSTLVPPPWCPHRSCSRHRIFVDHNEKRHLISRALGAQILNPGSVSRHVKREFVDVSPRAGTVRGHFATVSLSALGSILEPKTLRTTATKTRVHDPVIKTERAGTRKAVNPQGYIRFEAFYQHACFSQPPVVPAPPCEPSVGNFVGAPRSGFERQWHLQKCARGVVASRIHYMWAPRSGSR
jgi:hypothetical protein